jgi:toxin ParE1/3/4
MMYRLTQAAREDLIQMYMEGVRQFGVAQAEKYQDDLERVFNLLGANPLLARERLELTPPVRIHPSASHLIVYKVGEDGILIIRIRHHLEDWVDDPF